MGTERRETGWSTRLLQAVRGWVGRDSVGTESPEADGGTAVVEVTGSSVADPFAAFSEKDLEKAELLTEIGLTPEEYILEELSTQGGRLKQQNIIEHTGWSASSVSRLLSKMEGDDRIVRLRLGRENVVFLPGAIPRQVLSGRADVSKEAGTTDR